LVLESEVYHDARFRETLCDAVESLEVGPAWKLSTKVGPLIRPPSGVLETGLKELEPSEEWAVMPRLHVDDNPSLVAPGVKWGVQPGGFTHCTELFGPVLGVMEARDLDHAIELVNATGYGLTSGLESLDDREQDLWREKIRAGNLYINRPTTGAIVLRQPFGGMGKSSVGPGIKAGGPNYVVPLMAFAEEEEKGDWSIFASKHGNTPTSPPAKMDLSPFSISTSVTHLTELRRALELVLSEERVDADEIRRVMAAIDSYAEWGQAEFGVAHDHFRLLGEDNFRRYLPVEPLRIRVHTLDTLADVFCRATAARAAGSRATVSVPPTLVGPPSRGGREATDSDKCRSARGTYSAAEAVELLDRLTDSWAGAIEFVEEEDSQLAEAIRAGQVARLRYAAPERVPTTIRAAAAEALQYVADSPVSAHGRIELLWYVREQSIAHMYHRYGNLGIRTDEQRDEPA
jgi:RHH-type transcriptional regulator, proline utilization regulon repressor / proline dehydrogenase / delta 1-pyrroline-5-carboxylate dehydrogenase